MVRQRSNARVRAIRRAVQAWNSGKPHVAWETLATAGYADYWPIFQRVVLRHARARFLNRMG